jgi:hypothetical protein
MKKLFLLFLLIPTIAWATPPSRTYTYVEGTVINPTEVTTNEDNIFNYLTRGVDTYVDGSITTDDILDGTITNNDISGTAAIADTKLGEISNGKLAAITTANKVAGSALYGLTGITYSAGIIPTDNIATGITAGKIVQLTSSAKLPVISGLGANDASEVTGIAASQIPNLDASKITSGTIATARLGSGSASATTFLSGDQSYKTITIWNHSGTEAFSSNPPPSSWTDLDLSSIVGANYALVMLRIAHTGSTVPTTFHFRPNGDTGDIATADTGCASIVINTQNNVGYVTVETSSAGVIEWIASGSSGRETQVVVQGYLK